MRESMAKQMNTFDSRINALESQLEASLPPSSAQAGKGMPPPAGQAKPAPVVTAGGASAAPGASLAVTGGVTGAATASAEAPGDATKVASGSAAASSDAMLFEPKTWGRLDPGNGKGFVLARTDKGELDMTIVTYFRYLNQKALQPDYTFYFGKTIPLDLKEDFQLNKVNLTFKGWLYDERFRYLMFIWTNNSVAHGWRPDVSRRQSGVRLFAGVHAWCRYRCLADDPVDNRQLSQLAAQRQPPDGRRVFPRFVHQRHLRRRPLRRQVPVSCHAGKQPQHDRGRRQPAGTRAEHRVGLSALDAVDRASSDRRRALAITRTIRKSRRCSKRTTPTAVKTRRNSRARTPSKTARSGCRTVPSCSIRQACSARRYRIEKATYQMAAGRCRGEVPGLCAGR